MSALASTRTPGTLLSLEGRPILRVGIGRIVRAARAHDADERLEAIEGRPRARSARSAVGRILRHGLAHDVRLGAPGRRGQTADLGFCCGIEPDAERHVSMSYISVGHRDIGGKSSCLPGRGLPN